MYHCTTGIYDLVSFGKRTISAIDQIIIKVLLG
jgi:hypothetical protein